MSDLLLNSLEIEGYRGFDHLVIPKLGRVNLVVGKNNAGKSSLLEALWLFAKGSEISELRAILIARDEFPERPPQTDKGREKAWEVKHLFYGRPDIRQDPRSIKIGSLEQADNKLEISIKWLVGRTDEWGETDYTIVDDPIEQPDAQPFLDSSVGGKSVSWYSLDHLIGFGHSLGKKHLPGHFIPANGFGKDSITRLWDSIALTEWEDSVIGALNIIAPEIRRLSFIGKEEENGRRVPMVKIEGQAEPVYLRSMGEGMNRLLGIILSLVNSRDGILLIDEIESGLHYTIQPLVWRLIFQTACKLNVQVVATTHSWECIEAFQKASAEDQAEEAMLIRLENRSGNVTATLFDEHRLSVATREQIEVR